MNSFHVPPVLQVIGLACVPVDDMPQNSALARKPVAAAILTMRVRGDGHRDMSATCVSDARPLEFPLPALLDGALIAGTPVVITAADRDVLAVEAASRRFFGERKLAAVVRGDRITDPTAPFGGGYDEAALCRRLSIAWNPASDTSLAQMWDKTAPTAVEGIALAAAVARMTLWAHGASLLAAEPDPFFETLLPLRELLVDLDEMYPVLKPMTASRPIMRAASFASEYHAYRVKRDAGDTDARWVSFREDVTSV